MSGREKERQKIKEMQAVGNILAGNSHFWREIRTEYLHTTELAHI